MKKQKNILGIKRKHLIWKNKEKTEKEWEQVALKKKKLDAEKIENPMEDAP